MEMATLKESKFNVHKYFRYFLSELEKNPNRWVQAFRIFQVNWKTVIQRLITKKQMSSEADTNKESQSLG